MSTPKSQDIDILAHQIWEEQGRPEGKDKEHWAQAKQRLASDEQHKGLADDKGLKGPAQNTPGRPKTASSRQQTQPDQQIQSGSAALDGKHSSRSPRTSRN